MIYSIMANIILAALLVFSIWLGFKKSSSARKMKKNIEVLTDHHKTDAKVRGVQNSVKKKIIEAKNEKESDAVIKHIFSVANGSKL